MSSMTNPCPTCGQGWNPDMEAAPRDGRDLLLSDRGGICRVGFWVSPKSSRTPGWWASVPGRWNITAIYWRELPTPPETDEGEG